MANRSYGDDVFILNEDEIGRRKNHAVQYALVSSFAILVLAAAIFMGWWLTERRLEYQNSILTDNQTEGTDSVSEWPTAQFPGVPVLASARYDTNLYENRAEVNVPKAVADEQFEAYIERLADEGAQIYVRMDRLTVLNYRGTEIHLIENSGRSAVALCGEPRIDWDDPNYAQFPLPDKGQLVDVKTGTGEGSRWLTYRLLSASDAVRYASGLVEDGWSIVDALEPQGQVFACGFRKDSLQISVDYFSGAEDARVKLDFLQTQDEGAA